MATINFRIDEETKRVADALFADLGMTMSGAITIFLKRAIEYRGIPFEVRKAPPQIEEFREAVYDLEHDRKHWHYHSDEEIERLLAEAEEGEKRKAKTAVVQVTPHSRKRNASCHRKGTAA